MTFKTRLAVAGLAFGLTLPFAGAADKPAMAFIQYTAEMKADNTVTLHVQTATDQADVMVFKVFVFYSYTDANGGKQAGMKTLLYERQFVGNSDVSIPVSGLPVSASIRVVQLAAFGLRDIVTTAVDPSCNTQYAGR